MIKKILVSFLTVSFLLVIQSISVHASSPNLIADYDFNTNFSNSITNAISLYDYPNTITSNTPVNTTSTFGTSDSYWEWTSTTLGQLGGGFYIDIPTSVLANPSVYSLGIRFSLNQVGPGYVKILDFRDLVSDSGFYYLNGEVKIYTTQYENSAITQTPVTDGQVVDLIITRDSSKNFKVFIIDGSTVREIYNYVDSSNYAVPLPVSGNTRFHFFHDDVVQKTEFANGGKIYSLKIWDGPITPSASTMGTALGSTPTPITTVSTPTPYVTPVEPSGNSAPSSSNVRLSAKLGSSIAYQLTGTDLESDSLWYQLLNTTTQTTALVFNSDGSIQYTPTDSNTQYASYQVCDTWKCSPAYTITFSTNETLPRTGISEGLGMTSLIGGLLMLVISKYRS